MAQAQHRVPQSGESCMPGQIPVVAGYSIPHRPTPAVAAASLQPGAVGPEPEAAAGWDPLDSDQTSTATSARSNTGAGLADSLAAGEG